MSDLPLDAARDFPTVLVWGTFDLGKPRTRIILAALEEAGLRVERIHAPIWDGIEDKSGLSGRIVPLRIALRYVSSILRLWVRALRAPRHDVVLIGYLGHIDVIAFRPLAWLTGKPVVWDAFLSLYDTVAIDRAMLPRSGIVARMVRAVERFAVAGAERVVLDTAPHAARFAALLDVPAGKMAAVPVGVESASFPALPPKTLPGEGYDGDGGPLTLLFYGQFIPLHGIETIVQAARLAAERGFPWRWRLIGTGQTAPRIRADLEAAPVAAIEWAEWVPYETLSDEIGAADICLGIFGESEKAASVVPNKVYQIIASGRPLVTRDSPAMRAFASEPAHGLALIPPADPKALVTAILELVAALRQHGTTPEFGALRASFALPALADAWERILSDAARDRGRKRGGRGA